MGGGGGGGSGGDVNYSPDGFNTHYRSMQHDVSLINLFPHTHRVVEADHASYLGIDH